MMRRGPRIPASDVVIPLRLRGVLANAYPATTANPAQRYFLREFRFDHTCSVTGPTTPGADCGGFETPMCFAFGIQPNSYVRASDGVEYPFVLANPGVTVRSGGDCLPPVTTEATTWGQIKSQYRR